METYGAVSLTMQSEIKLEAEKAGKKIARKFAILKEKIREKFGLSFIRARFVV
jgi:hypothetical protein